MKTDIMCPECESLGGIHKGDCVMFNSKGKVTFSSIIADILEEWYMYEEDKDFSILQAKIVKTHKKLVEDALTKVFTLNREELLNNKVLEQQYHYWSLTLKKELGLA